MFSLMLLDLTLYEVLTDIPHDSAAVVVYAMLVLFVGFIWYGSRSPSPLPSGSSEPAEKREDAAER